MSAIRKHFVIISVLIISVNLLFFDLRNSFSQSLDNKNQVVAEVNGQKIYASELEQAVKREQSFSSEHLEIELLNQLKKELLKRLIERKLLLQEAKEKKLIIDDRLVKEKLIKLRESFTSEQEFEQTLKENGLTEKKLIEGLKEDLAIISYLNNFIYSKLSIAEEELKNYYQNNLKSLEQSKELHLRQILFKLPQNVSAIDEEIIRKKAIEVLSKAKNNINSFSELAEKYSEGPDRFNKGDLGFVTQNQLDQEFSNYVFKMRVGEISDLIKTKYGYHIVTVEEEHPAAIPDYGQVRDRLEKSLLDEKKAKTLSQHLKELKEKGSVIIYLE